MHWPIIATVACTKYLGILMSVICSLQCQHANKCHHFYIKLKLQILTRAQEFRRWLETRAITMISKCYAEHLRIWSPFCSESYSPDERCFFSTIFSSPSLNAIVTQQLLRQHQAICICVINESGQLIDICFEKSPRLLALSILVNTVLTHIP